jgi:hypothetical protein
MGLGGTKLERSKPWHSKSAIHSASFTSVLRPGTFLTCCALATTISNAPSRMAYTGFQYTPVLSMATWVQPCDSSHSRKASSSRVVVPKVRTCFWTCAFFKTINKQATTVA